MNLIAPADGECLRAVGQVIRNGRTLTICEMKAFILKAGRETQCLHGMATLMCLPGRADGPRGPDFPSGRVIADPDG